MNLLAYSSSSVGSNLAVEQQPSNLYNKVISRIFYIPKPVYYLIVTTKPDTHYALSQNWMAFSKLHKPFFCENGFAKFPNTNPPKDEDNNAYCEVS